MRPREFKEDEVVERLEAAFWSHGFEGLSLEQLTERTGLSRSSLYNAFGSKSGMMRAAVDGYAARSCAALAEAIARRPLRDALRNLLQVAAGLTGPGEGRRLGCLIGNLIAERAVDARDKAYLGERLCDLEAALADGLRRAADEGALAPGADPERLARFLNVQLQGLRLVSRAHQEPAALRDAVDLAFAALDPHLT